ncbi:MAG TPA: hypothetical protein VGN00_09370 [Puia sp.]|jgi:hypothetical protein
MKPSYVFRGLFFAFVVIDILAFWLWLVWIRRWTMVAAVVICVAGAIASYYFAEKAEKQGL